MNRAATYRKAIENSPDFARAKAKALQLLLKSVRFYIAQYAAREFIVEFADKDIVEDVHREFRQDVIDTAKVHEKTVKDATTTVELLAAFDGFSEWIAW